jgi:hypothetical protein
MPIPTPTWNNVDFGFTGDPVDPLASAADFSFGPTGGLELLFARPKGQPPVSLVFGAPPPVLGAEHTAAISVAFPLAVQAVVVPQDDATISVVFPLAVQALVAPLYEAAAVVLFPEPTSASVVTYDPYVDRPLVGDSRSGWEEANDVQSGVQSYAQVATHLNTGPESWWDLGLPLCNQLQASTRGALSTYSPPLVLKYEKASRLGMPALEVLYEDGLRDRRPRVSVEYEEAVSVKTGAWTSWQERYRDRRPRLSVEWEEASPTRVGRTHKYRTAKQLTTGVDPRHQWAMRPPVGNYVPVIPPGPTPCYWPDPDLVFQQSGKTVTTRLLFACQYADIPETVVVPVLRTYIVANSLELKTVVGNHSLACTRLSMSLDHRSWTWTFNALLDGDALSYFPAGGGAVELKATLNGVDYRLLGERVTRRREFGKSELTVSGRGRIATLSAPYAEIKTFSNSGLRTSQQLMDEVLMDNGIPIGWTVDFGLTAWDVPTGLWNHHGTYIDALQRIAQSAGGYIQPHPTDQVVKVLHDYPLLPRDWASITPDYVLPADVVINEGVEFIQKPEYNRVFVRGESQGVVCQSTITGSAGDLAAPMVVDPLISAVDAGRQRSRAILGDTGAQALLSLRLPVLDLTGIIHPGKFVEYNDGPTTHRGMVRSVSMEGTLFTMWQTIGVETHV